MTTKEAHVPSTLRWKLAVAELRSAYGQLEADDRRHNQHYGYRAGFGPPLAVTELRHARANPDEGGSLEDDVKKFL